LRDSLLRFWMPRQRRLVAALPFALMFALAACQGSTVVEKRPPTQGAPPVGGTTGAGSLLQVPSGAGTQETLPPTTTETQSTTGQTAGSDNRQTVKVALLLPLSGPGAPLGKALLNAATLAVFDIAGKNFVLLPRDTGGSADGAARAARAALDEGAKLILGPFFAEEVLAVAPLAREAGINVVAFSTDERVAGQGVFLMGFLPRTQVTRVVSYAHQQGLNRFAAVVPNTSYGQAIAGFLRTSVNDAGASLGAIESYDPAAGNAAEVVRRIANYDTRHAALLEQRRLLEAQNDELSREALQRLQKQDSLGDVDFDAIMLPEGGERLMALAPLLPYYDIDPSHVRVLGTGLWDDPRLAKEPALIGGWYVAPDPKVRGEFDRRYAKLFDAANAPRIATLGYDATALAVALAQSGPDFGARALTNPNGFAGLDGIFRFHEDGLNERGLAVLEIQREGPRVVSPAPASFATE